MKFQIVRALQLISGLATVALIIFYAGKWNTARLVGMMIAVPSFALLAVARFQLGRSFAVTPQAKALVTTGLYSKIRNPMYLFSFLLVTGLVIGLQRPYLYLLLAVLAIVQMLRIRQEARVLEAKFGERYRDYRKHTWF